MNKIKLQTTFKWNELTEIEKREILNKFNKRELQYLLKFCNEFSIALFKKDRSGNWFISNIMLLSL